MNILAHRGYWNSDIINNSPKALRTSLEKGFGFESDVRDYDGRMVISHNIADAACQDADEVFQWLSEFQDKYCFAINIKADGLKGILSGYLSKYNISNYFLFDMSVPQMIEFRDIGLRFFTRQSEVEPHPVMYEEAAGVWIDGFWGTDWITCELLKDHINNKKYVCIVSPDLHGNINYKEFWNTIKNYEMDDSMLMLCTDHPEEAKEIFSK